MMHNHPGMGSAFYSPADAGAGSGGTADASVKGSGTDTADAGKQAKTFTESDVNSIVSKRVGEVQAKLSDELKAARDQMSEMQRLLDQRKIADAEGQKQYEEAKRLREEGFAKELAKERQAREQAETRYRDTAVTQAITAAAAQLRATKPEQVVALLREAIKFDDTGTPRFSDGSAIEDGVKKFLADNPHMVQAGGRSGGSGANNVTGANAAGMSKPLHEMTPDEIRTKGGGAIIRDYQERDGNPFRRPVARNKD